MRSACAPPLRGSCLLRSGASWRPGRTRWRACSPHALRDDAHLSSAYLNGDTAASRCVAERERQSVLARGQRYVSEGDDGGEQVPGASVGAFQQDVADVAEQADDFTGEIALLLEL